MAGEKNNNSGGILGLVGLAAVIASWFFVFTSIGVSVGELGIRNNEIIWEKFLNFWANDLNFQSLDSYILNGIVILPILFGLIALPAFLRSSYFQARIPSIILGILLLGTLVYRLLPLAENEANRMVFRFLTDFGLVTVGPGLFLFLGGSALILISGLRAKG